MPVYGRTFTLDDPAKFDIGAKAVGGGKAGKYTGESGVATNTIIICSQLGRASNLSVGPLKGFLS